MRVKLPKVSTIRTDITKEDEAWLKGFKVGYCIAEDYANRKSSFSDHFLSLILRCFLSARKVARRWKRRIF